MFRNPTIRRAAATVAAAALIVSACGGGSDDSSDGGDSTEATTGGSAAEGGGEYTVYALLPQGNDQPYGTTYLPPFEETAASLGMSLTITNSQYDADTQASDCEVAVSAQPDAIVLWPAVADTVRPCLQAAADAGIPVTVTNSDVREEDASLTAAYSGPDTYGQGVASAEIMCEITAGADVGILMVNGLTGNTTAIDREKGFEDTINEKCPNVTILARQPGDWNKDDSQNVTEEMISSVGAENIGGLYAADDTMVAGAIDALKARDIDPKPLFITSIGNTKLGNPLVISGELDGTVFQSSSWDGEHAATAAHSVLTGGGGDRVVEFMPNVKVTAENAEDPAVAPEW